MKERIRERERNHEIRKCIVAKILTGSHKIETKSSKVHANPALLSLLSHSKFDIQYLSVFKCIGKWMPSTIALKTVYVLCALKSWISAVVYTFTLWSVEQARKAFAYTCTLYTAHTRQYIRCVHCTVYIHKHCTEYGHKRSICIWRGRFFNHSTGYEYYWNTAAYSKSPSPEHSKIKRSKIIGWSLIDLVAWTAISSYMLKVYQSEMKWVKFFRIADELIHKGD